MRRGTHEVVPLDSCALMPEAFNRDILPWLRMLPPAEQVVVRLDGRGGWLISIFGNPSRLKLMKKILAALPEGEPPAPGCAGLMFNNLPLWGRDYLIHEIAGHKFRVGAQSFFQGNHEVTEEALAVVRDWIGELEDADRLGGLLGDLFCGVGLFSLALADLFDKVVAIDSDANSLPRRAQQHSAQRPPPGTRSPSISAAWARSWTSPNWRPPHSGGVRLCLVDPPADRPGQGRAAGPAGSRSAPRPVHELRPGHPGPRRGRPGRRRLPALAT